MTAGELLSAAGLAVVTATALVAVLYACGRVLRRREYLRRGFEVKQNTGGPPVLREKDQNHG